MLTRCFSMLSVSDASICNRDCKRLQPHLQTFASAKSCVYLHHHLPSEKPKRMLQRALSDVSLEVNMSSKMPFGTTFGRLRVRKGHPK